MDEDMLHGPWKWAGSSREARPLLLSWCPPNLGDYRLCVPFAGAGNFFGAVAAHTRGQPLLADYTRPLVLTHRALKASPERVKAEIAGFKVNRKQFMAVRKRLSEVVKRRAHPGNKYTVAADFLYLMRTGYNGLWRCSQKGNVNTPWGKPAADFDVWSPAMAKAAQNWHRLLRDTDAQVECQDFRVTLRKALDWEGPVLVFADPPYWPLQIGYEEGLLGRQPVFRDSWEGYTPIGFSARDHGDLLALLSEHRRRGNYVLSTNHKHDLWEERYWAEGFEAEHFDNRRNGNSDKDGRGPVKEVLFIGRPG